MRRVFSSLAWRYFPRKEVSERVVPWFQLFAGALAGIWALVQYSNSVADRRADETLKLLAAYSTEPKEGKSLKASFDKLWEQALQVTKSNPAITALQDKANKSEAEKATLRKMMTGGLRSFAVANYEEYSRIYFYMSTVVACASENRCDQGIVNSVIGPDLFFFLNGACGFIAEYDNRWGSSRTGRDIYDYVVSQGIEKKSEAHGTSPFFCEKFRVLYLQKSQSGWWTRLVGD